MASEVSSPPNKRTKTLTESTAFNLKGKDKIEEVRDENEQESMESDSKVCGICFSEDGMAIRGAIDSCNHHFCFVCIMEWSKIESRCPLCKQRFSTIRRPPKDGVFLRERIVNVPIRDQVWHPYGNMSTGPSDPYEQVQCTECHRSVDENLLLLCDLCDSAAHTYCIGLGATIPEGDWYCHDCTVSRDDHTSSQIDTDCCNQESGRIGTVRLASVNVHTNSQMDVNGSRTNDTTRVAGTNVSIARDDHASEDVDTYGYNRDSSNSDTTQVADANVSISEIVQESYERKVDRSSRRVVLLPDQLPPPEVPVRNISVGTIATDPSARTLRRCRNVHNRIHALRENWNALRSGSLGFASNLTDSSSQSSTKKYKNRAVAYEKPSLPQSSSSPCLQILTNENVAEEALNKQGSCDTDKAWKMLDIAKSFQRGRGGKNSKHRVSNHQLGKRKISMEVTVQNSCFSSLRSKKDVGESVSAKNCMNHSLGIAHRKHKTRATENLKPVRDVLESWKLQKRRLSTTQTSRYCKLSSDRQVQKLVQLDVCRENSRKPPLKVMHGASSGLISKQVGMPSTVSMSESTLGGSVPTYNRSEFGASVDCKGELPKENGGLENISTTVMARKDDGAKSEVQSLVKLNLKLLNREKQLGVDGFKEVARLATHTILAACGLEHKTSSVRPFPSSICTHNNQSQQQRMSNLMTRSCRECFYVFVKDVVSSIMTDKITCIPSSSGRSTGPVFHAVNEFATISLLCREKKLLRTTKEDYSEAAKQVILLMGKSGTKQAGGFTEAKLQELKVSAFPSHHISEVTDYSFTADMESEFLAARKKKVWGCGAESEY